MNGTVRFAGVLGLALLAIGAAAPSPPEEAVRRMLTRVLRAPEVQSRVVILRRDPFGGPPDRSEGRIWFLPGRGLRFRATEEDIVADKERGEFLVYRPAEETLYRAEWDRAPARMRQLVTTPERLLDADYHATRERRKVNGAWREGYRLRRASLGDSLPAVSVWLAPDPATGLPRWVSAGGEDDSVDIEFQAMTVRSKANPRDLVLTVPKSAHLAPLDPRDLLPGGESR